MLMPLMMSLFATNLAHSGATGMFGVNQSRLALANGVTGNESQGDIASLAAQDKALTLQGIQAKTQYEVAQALQDTATRMKKKNEETRQRMLENGVLFF